MLKKTFLSAVLAGLISGVAHSQAEIVPVAKAPGAPAVAIAPFSANNLNSIFDGQGGSPFRASSFLKTSNGFAAKKRASVESQAASFVEKARRLFGNPRVFTRRGPKGIRPAVAPTDGELNDEVRMSPKENAERERVIRELFIQAGAKAEDIKSQDIGRGKHNFIVVKPGKTDRIIVVGGHHDKVSAGMGTIDNWTGATMVANLYQQIREQDTEHTYVFIAFGREEEGLLGSAAYIRSLTQGQLSKIDNMVNLDTLGVDGTYSWKNNSDQNLLQEFRAVADRERLDLTEMYLDGGDADSSSFRKAGVKAVTIFGASPDVIFDIIHSSRDNFGVFSLPHYVNAFKLTAATLLSLDRKPSPDSPRAAPDAVKARLLAVVLFLAGCAATVRVKHIAAPEKLGPAGGARLSRLYILVRAPQPLDADASKAQGLLEALSSLVPDDQDKAVRRDLNPEERESLGRAVAQRFAQAGSAAAYQAVYDEKAPAAMGGFAATASLWLTPSQAQARQESFDIEVSSTNHQIGYKVRGEYGVAWRLLAEPGGAFLAEGRVPSAGQLIEEEHSTKSSDLESNLQGFVRQRQGELVASLGDALLPHPVERVRYIRKGKGLFKDAFARLNAQDWEGAAALWRQLTSSNPADHTPHHHLGVYYERLGRWNEAHQEYSAAADASGESGKEAREALVQLDAMAKIETVQPSTIPFLTERIAVMPFANESVDLNAPVYMRLKTAKELKDRGYSVQSAAETDAALRGIGITDGGQIRAADRAKLAKTVGADRLLFGDVEEFRTVNVGLYSKRQVRLSLQLTDAAGAELWRNKAQTVRQDLAQPKKALTKFLITLASTQIEKVLNIYLKEEADLTVLKILEPLPRTVARSR